MTIALEFVPPDTSGGPEKAREDAGKAREQMTAAGMEGRIDSLLIPGMIPEESDRAVRLEEKMDPLAVKAAIADELPLACIVTQVTAFSSVEALGARIGELRDAGVRRAVFVGVPRTLADGEGPGVSPADALGRFGEAMPGRGVILIPTRDDEKPRFEAKAKAGANFALCQMLFSDHMAGFLPTVELPEPRPEILLSFGYVPKMEKRVGLIRWLIRDETEQAKREMAFVEEIAGKGFKKKRTALMDVYKRTVDPLLESGFPLGLHFECPYGFSRYAFDLFHAMLDHWSPDR